MNSNLPRELDTDEVRLGSIRTALLCQYTVNARRPYETHCQNVSGSSSVKHSGPNPNLYDDTDHLPR